MAKHLDLESCVIHREVYGEALAGETSRPAIESRNHESGAPTLLCEAEGHSVYDDIRCQTAGGEDQTQHLREAAARAARCQGERSGLRRER